MVVEVGNADGKERWRSVRRGSEGEMESEVVMVKNGRPAFRAGEMKYRVTGRGTALSSSVGDSLI